LKISNDIELLDGLPIAYIQSLEMLVCTDLHLGYEGAMSKNGMLLPKANLKNILASIDEAIKLTGAKHLLVDGDIKNEFSGVEVEEFNELYDFIHFISQKGLSLTLIKGNHDNFVERYKSAFSFEVYRQQHRYGNYLFFHGEEMPQSLGDASMLIMGHEHPAITVYTSAGKAERIRCFLIGSYKGRELMVLPAMSYYSPGTSVNVVPKEELLAPMFKHVKVDDMTAIAVGYGSTINFGKIGMLRRAIENRRSP